jgi:hypothetical protein
MLPDITKEEWIYVRDQTYDIEFDWVGQDIKGHLGIFSSFNRGFVPQIVTESFENYQKVSFFIKRLPNITFSIASPMFGANYEHWFRYARKGLFAFDNQDVHGKEQLNQYELVAKPAEPILFVKTKEYNDVKGFIPTFNLTFENEIDFKTMKEKLINH